MQQNIIIRNITHRRRCGRLSILPKCSQQRHKVAQHQSLGHCTHAHTRSLRLATEVKADRSLLCCLCTKVARSISTFTKLFFIFKYIASFLWIISDLFNVEIAMYSQFCEFMIKIIFEFIETPFSRLQQYLYRGKNQTDLYFKWRMHSPYIQGGGFSRTRNALLMATSCFFFKFHAFKRVMYLIRRLETQVTGWIS